MVRCHPALPAADPDRRARVLAPRATASCEGVAGHATVRAATSRARRADGARSGLRHLRRARPRGRRWPTAAPACYFCSDELPRQVSRPDRMTPPNPPLRADIVEVGRRMYARGYTASNDGNISVRLGADRLLMTPKSVCKGFMTPGHDVHHRPRGPEAAGRPRSLVRDADAPRGLPAAARRAGGRARASADATGFAVAGIPLDRAVLAEVLTTLGSIPIAEYATPSTKELPEAVRKYIKAHDGMLLANHGALTVGARSVRRVLQDGNDRALRQDQPRGAAARAART